MTTKTQRLARRLGAFALAVGCAMPVTAKAATFSTDFLAAETANDEDGSFGPWTVGGYDNPTSAPGTFIPYTSAQHLDNWGSLLPGGSGAPFTAGEFKGYGYDTGLAIPAVVINTTAASIAPCCGISAYAPGEIFVHSSNTTFGDPAPEAQVVRYTVPGNGTVDISVLFTQKHSGPIPWAVYVNGALPEVTATGTINGQDLTGSYSTTGLAVLAGDVIDFVIAGRASASLAPDVDFVPEPASLGLIGFGGLLLARRRKA